MPKDTNKSLTLDVKLGFTNMGLLEEFCGRKQAFKFGFLHQKKTKLNKNCNIYIDKFCREYLVYV